MTWLEAIEQVGVKVCQSTAYRWVRCWRDKGEAGLSDERHGHLYKMTPEIQAWLKASCGQAPYLPSSQVKELIQEKFKVEISRGHLNRVRAELGVSRPKKAPAKRKLLARRSGQFVVGRGSPADRAD